MNKKKLLEEMDTRLIKLSFRVLALEKFRAEHQEHCTSSDWGLITSPTADEPSAIGSKENPFPALSGSRQEIPIGVSSEVDKTDPLNSRIASYEAKLKEELEFKKAAKALDKQYAELDEDSKDDSYISADVLMGTMMGDE